MRRRPPGWQPPGPVPPGSGGDPSLEPAPDETLDCLAGHWRIFQLRRGHRYSTDDLLTAWYAVSRCREHGLDPRDGADLGCGVGSVLLLVLWSLPRLRAVGVEAQAASAALARRSLRYNGVDGRAEVREADFRSGDALGADERFDLVTASPPYLLPGEGRRSGLPQRGPCRFEDRGGAADYLAAAAAHLRPGGLVAWVHATRYRDENLTAAARVGLRVLGVRPVVFREGRESLVSLFCAGLCAPLVAVDEPPLTVRRSDGRWSDEYRAVRRQMGFPAEGGSGEATTPGF